jgi:hypothetical protein
MATLALPSPVRHLVTVTFHAAMTPETRQQLATLLIELARDLEKGEPVRDYPRLFLCVAEDPLTLAEDPRGRDE